MSGPRMSPRGGYFTQCDQTAGPWGCRNFTQLKAPSQWRCPECVLKHGPRPVEK